MKFDLTGSTHDAEVHASEAIVKQSSQTVTVENFGASEMRRTLRHRDFMLQWEEPTERAPGRDYQWTIEVSSDYPRMLEKMGGRSQTFVANSREQAIAEAIGFVDSLSLF